MAFAPVGAARRARQALTNLLDHGFSGQLFCVGSERPFADRSVTVARVRELPPQADLLVLDAPPHQVQRLVQEAAEMSIPGVLILSQDASIRELEQLHRAYPSTRIIGPSSRGLIVPRLQLNASITPGMPVHGGLAVISSSALLWEELMFRAARARVGLSHLISLGEQVDVSVADVADYLHARGRVRALVVEADRLPAAQTLLPALWAFARDRPLFARKSGPYWERAVFSSVLRRVGGVPLRYTTEVLNLLELLSHLGHPPPGDKMALLVSAEHNESLRKGNKPTAQLSPATRQLLGERGCTLSGGRSLLPPKTTDRDWKEALEAMLDDPSVHMLLASAPPRLRVSTIDDVVAAATRAGKPLAIVTEDIRWAQILRDRGIAVYESSADAAAALGCLAEYVGNLDLLHSPWGCLPARPDREELPELPPGEISTELLARVLACWGISLGPTSGLGSKQWFCLRLRRHPLFGTVLLVSRSGDPDTKAAVGVPPLSEPLARSLLSELPGHLPPLGESGLLQLVLKLSRLALDLPQIEQLELHPVCLTGGEAAPLGAWGRTAADLAGPHLCLSPYPEDRVLPICLKDGSEATLRPIRPDDVPLWHTMLTSSSPKSLRLRYHSVHHEPSRRMARRHCCVDYRREFVMVAEIVHRGSSLLAGEGELFMDSDHDLAEFAVFVADAWQGRGLGSILTNHMVSLAQELGARRVACELTPDNVRMITLLQRRGFSVCMKVEDGVVFADKHLR